uniref:Aminopeptidase P family protein n=1 Tax=Steinernema glaseri TaxID=37863 RepID=A0A1I7Y0A4_9BILA
MLDPKSDQEHTEMVMARIEKAQRIREAHLAGEYDQDTMFRGVGHAMGDVGFPESYTECLNQSLAKTPMSLLQRKTFCQIDFGGNMTEIPDTVNGWSQD